MGATAEGSNQYERLLATIRESPHPVAWAIAAVEGRNRLWRVMSCPFCNAPHDHDAPGGWHVDLFQPIGTLRSGCDRGSYLVFRRITREALARYCATHRAPISPGLRARIMETTQGRCWYCGTDPATAIDHQIPVALGGTNDPANLVPACSRCNHLKKAKTVDHFRVAMGGGPFWFDREQST